jgi:hypothetical protein
VLMQDRCTVLRQTYHRLKNHLGSTELYSKLTKLNWMLVSVRLKIVLILMQDRCMVCVERNKGSEIILDPHLMELLGDVGHVESCIGPFRGDVRVGVI